MASLDLVTTLRSTGAAREFHPDPVPDEVLAAPARHRPLRPSGGNRQGWRVIVVKDPDKRRALRDLISPGWYEYLAMGAAGGADEPAGRPGGRSRRGPAHADAGRHWPRRPGRPTRASPRRWDTAPALLLVSGRPAPHWPTIDRDLPRYTFVGGASIYPFVWSLLLAAADRRAWGE